MRPHIYLTLNGVLGHIGYSQVFRPLEVLAQKGFRPTLASLERASDLKDTQRLRSFEHRAKSAGVAWVRATYSEGGGVRDVLSNLARLHQLSARAAKDISAGIIHARGYHGALIGYSLHRRLSIPWVFDARGSWIDERIEEGRWFTNPAAEKAARHVEATLYRSASEVVTLTNIHANHLLSTAPAPLQNKPTVITTCADFQTFRPRPPESSPLPTSITQTLDGSLVIGIVGSINRAYKATETARLASLTSQYRRDMKFLILSGQHREWRRLLMNAGVPSERILATQVPHEEIPHWMNRMSWCLMLLRSETAATRAAMPTKLGELFASGVRVAFHGCNSEAADWVRKIPENIVLNDLSQDCLERAAVSIARAPTGGSQQSRGLTQEHFDLARGVTKYINMLSPYLRE